MEKDINLTEVPGSKGRVWQHLNHTQRVTILVNITPCDKLTICNIIQYEWDANGEPNLEVTPWFVWEGMTNERIKLCRKSAFDLLSAAWDEIQILLLERQAQKD